MTMFSGTPQDTPTLRRQTRRFPRPVSRTRWSLNLERPISMEAYNLLGLDDFTATSSEILEAWQVLAWHYHPSLVEEQQLEVAAMDMQRIDAVKDMLLDPVLREQYYDTGIMP